jgi:hypothetical protein
MLNVLPPPSQAPPGLAFRYGNHGCRRILFRHNRKASIDLNWTERSEYMLNALGNRNNRKMHVAAWIMVSLGTSSSRSISRSMWSERPESGSRSAGGTHHMNSDGVNEVDQVFCLDQCREMAIC